MNPFVSAFVIGLMFIGFTIILGLVALGMNYVATKINDTKDKDCEEWKINTENK